MAANKVQSSLSPPSERAKAIEDLPDEILQQVLYFLPPQNILLEVQRVSRRLYALSSQPLLWRHHCLVQFRYWDPKHRIRQKFLGGVGDVDWNALYAHRAKVHLKTTRILDSILEGQVDRINKFKLIADFGYDAKDTLLHHCHTHDNAEDVLARSYYANSVLDLLHRSKALAEWAKIVKGEKVSLERALGSFDLFVLHDQTGDYLEVSDLFDNLVTRFHVEYPDTGQLSTRDKALAVASFLREHDLTGVASARAYRDLQNNFISIALQDPDHPSLPLISVAIFCAVAQRVGLDASFCGMPAHVHARVRPPKNETLDGKRSTYHDDAEVMYLDPYQSATEVPVLNLRRTMGAIGVVELTAQTRALRESSLPAMIVRNSRNILATVDESGAHGGNLTANHRPAIRLHANPFADLDNALYSALWANFLFIPHVGLEDNNLQQIIGMLLDKFEQLYPMDASLIEQYMCPLYNNPSIALHWELRETLRVVRAADQTPKQMKLRDTAAARDGVRHKVGQVFRHRRYGYMAVITGWDIECGMDQNWIEHMDVDSLSRGRQQSFYHSLVEDTSIRYVAEENIEIVEPEVPEALMSLAGRYFKRWDRENRIFVSNIRDEYPED